MLDMQGFAGRNHPGGTDNAAAAPLKCAAITLFFCPSAEPVDGDAIRCWRLCAEFDEVCLF